MPNPPYAVRSGALVEKAFFYRSGSTWNNVLGGFSLLSTSAWRDDGDFWEFDVVLVNAAKASAGCKWTVNINSSNSFIKTNSETHRNNIINTTYTTPFTNAYNNYDVNFYSAVAAYTVTFDSQGGSDVPSQAVNHGDLVTEPVNPTRADYAFEGWYKEDTLLIPWDFAADTMPGHDITLYAKWSHNGGAGVSYATLVVEGKNENGDVIYNNSSSERIGDTLMVNAPIISGYTLNDDDSKTITIAYGENKVTFLYEKVLPSLLVDKHIRYIFGYPDGTVRPDRNITRAEAAAIACRLIEKPDSGQSGISGFSDIAADSWYHHEVAYIENHGIISGYPDGTFRPEKHLTRAEFLKIVSVFGELDTTAMNKFSDVPGDHWAIGYINNAAAKGWIGGYEDGTFKPDENLVRAQAVSIINYILDRKIELEAIPDNAVGYKDITNKHWAYCDIIEASN